MENEGGGLGESEDNDRDNLIDEGVKEGEKINQSQFYELITNDEVSWQSIIFDLVKTEQLDPWNIDLMVLSERYILVINEMEDANFFVSSKVLLACSLLLRLKSEILVNRDIPSLNEILFGSKPAEKKDYERIEIDEEEVPILVPRTPMPRSRKVTLNELMSALNKAIETENRRIIREVNVMQAKKQTSIVLPKINRISLKDRIKVIYTSLRGYLKHPQKIEMPYSELAPSKEEKIYSFLPILHLSNKKKLFLYQEQHFEEIFMRLDRKKEEIQNLIEQLGEDIDTDVDVDLAGVV